MQLSGLARRYQRAAPLRNIETVAKLREIAADDSVFSPAPFVERAAASIARTMAQVHGGEWLILIDHQRRAVLIWEERG